MKAVAAGVVVVVAAGNKATDAGNLQPANCANVVTVGATLRSGALAPYSNYGPSLDLSAPGGGPGGYLVSTWNFGTTVRAAEGYVYTLGSSLAAAHVSGTAALMQSKQVSTPAAVEAMLKSTARPFPEGCVPGCGTGIVNAAAALGAAMGGALSIDDVAVEEGSANSPAVMTFTVRLSKPMPSAVNFDIATSIGSADVDDFGGLYHAGQSIAAGTTSKQFAVAVLGDSTPESNEAFTISVSNVTGIAEPMVRRREGFARRSRGARERRASAGWSPGQQRHENAGRWTVRVVLPVRSAGTTTLVFRVGSTYSSGDTDLFVKRGSRPSLSEADCISANTGSFETCTIENPQPGTYYVMVYGYLDSWGILLTGTYAPKVAGLNTFDTTSSESARVVFFTARLSEAVSNDVTFKVSTEAGTAVAGEDFEPLEGVEKRIPAGSTELEIQVPVIDDSQAELTESLNLVISDVQGAFVLADRANPDSPTTIPHS